MEHRGGWRIALACAVLVSACTGDDDGSGDSTDDGDGGLVEITIVSDDIPAGLDYDGASVPLPASQTGMVNLLENLVDNVSGEVNDEGVQLLDFSEFEGRLAESWEFDEATLTWTFHLRRDVVGCGGTTFDADDVIYTFERAKSVTGTIPVSWFEFNVAAVDGFTADVFEGDTVLGDEVQKIDDYTVTVRQSGPSQLFLPVMGTFATAILDRETMEEHATPDDPWSHEYMDQVNAPSFGPYCIERWVKDEEFVVTANPDYYRGAPAIDRVVYRKVPNSANRVAALRAGDADLVENLTPREFDSLRDIEGVTVAGVIGNENMFVHMNWDVPPFDDIRVRRAIAHAIPYDAIVDNGYLGQAVRWEGHVPSTFPGFHRSDVQYDYDPEEAARLLSDAGYPNGEGLDAFAGAFQLTYVAEKSSTLEPIATTIQAALREVGFPVELDPQPNSQFSDRLFVRKDLPFALDDQEKPVLIDAGYALFNAQISTEAGAPANNTNYSNPRVDELTAEANLETDPDARAEMLAEAQDILQEDVNWVPVVERRTQWAFASDLGGITWHPENSLRWFELSIGV
jgi:peptide/nickel transport system substrate-binding protein